MHNERQQLTNIDISNARSWFCVRSQPKREHIAAANLCRLKDLEIFNPRLRSRKLTVRGPVWMTESLFPNYLFARFSFETRLDDVKYTPGVSHVVHFGHRYPTVPEYLVKDLRQNFGEEELQLSTNVPEQGDQVTVTDRAFFGLQATVLRVMPARQRVQVLLEMLGRTTMAELSLKSVIPQNRPLPQSLLSAAMPA